MRPYVSLTFYILFFCIFTVQFWLEEGHKVYQAEDQGSEGREADGGEGHPHRPWRRRGQVGETIGQQRRQPHQHRHRLLLVQHRKSR